MSQHKKSEFIFLSKDLHSNKSLKYIFKNNVKFKNDVISSPPKILTERLNTYGNNQLKENVECPLYKKCPYYKKYQNLKNQLINILSSANKVNNFNASLCNTLENKSRLQNYLFFENEKLKKLIIDISSKRFNDSSNNNYKKPFQNQNTDDNKIHIKLKNLPLTPRNYNEKLKINNNVINNENNKNISSLKKLEKSPRSKTANLYNNIYNQDNSNKISKITNSPFNLNKNSKNFFKQNLTNINMRNNNLLSNNNPLLHYELIKNYTKEKTTYLYADTSKFSFLSTNADYQTLIKSNNIIQDLETLTNSDENFLRTIDDSSNTQLLKYCDNIILLIKDYKIMLKLGLRMKEFIKGSILLIDSIINSNSSKILIENICYILKCDRASLFIHDKTTDTLVVYSGEGLKKAQIKVQKDKGIVGACFMENKIIRIDDAYLDNRFNKEIDKKTNYRTKSILCHPLINKEGECFGVLEAINKINSHFNDDDEEFLKLLSMQASVLFTNLHFNDDNKYLVIKLCLILNYNLDIDNINCKFEFTEKTEDALLNLFNCIHAAFYFVENNEVVRYFKEKKVKKFYNNLGIVGEVIKSKEILVIANMKNSVNYNSIIDIPSSDGLLTFPVLEKKSNVIKGVVQVPFIGNLSKNGKPKEAFMKIIKILSKCIRGWIKRNDF